MNRLIIYISVFLCISLIFFACSGTKHLPEGEKLFTGADIKLESLDTLHKK